MQNLTLLAVACRPIYPLLHFSLHYYRAVARKKLITEATSMINLWLRHSVHGLVAFLVAYMYVLPYPPPEEKREGGNVYEKLARIVLCDVTLLHGNM